MNENLRDHHIDFYRGLAFVNMVVYHLLFNLKNFNLIELNVFTNTYTIIWRGFIIGTFLICAGVSIVLSYNTITNNIAAKGIMSNMLPVLSKLAIAAVIVTIATYIIFPHSYIYFGILHFILVAKILAIITLRLGGIFNGILGLGILITFFIVGSWNPFMNYYGVSFLPQETLDMINILPWLGLFFIGIFLGFYPFYRYLPLVHISWLMWMGRKPLILYLIHQAILFPLVYAIFLILN